MSAWITLLFSSSIDGSYARLSAASWGVVLGIIIEETPLFLKIAKWFRGKFTILMWNTGVIAWFKRREKVFEAIGFIMLALCLVLEIRFQGAAESAEKDARVTSETLVQGLRVRATDAEGKIAAAQIDAANATRDAATLGVTLGTLQTYVQTRQDSQARTLKEFEAKSQDNVAAIQRAQVEFNANLETANRRNAAIEARLAPRVLTADNIEAISNAVKGYTGQKFSGMILPAALDAIPLWYQINRALTDAGWVPVDLPPGLQVGSPPAEISTSADPDISILVPEDATSPFSVGMLGPRAQMDAKYVAQGQALTDALNAAGLKTTMFRAPAPTFSPSLGIIVAIGIRSE